MRRRTMLGAVAAGVVSGAFGGVLRRRTGPELGVTADPAPAGPPVTLSVDLLTGQTDADPARLRVTFRSTADGPRTVVAAYPFPFADRVGVERESDAKLVLAYEAVGDRGDCWRTALPNVRPSVDRHAVAPGDRRSVEWSVLGHPGNDTCFPRGAYRFETTYEVDGTTFDWGFTVRVRN
ncbi:hypothetical protein DMJ13_06680 [halophilic archaeon]|nr:hypothetical protein DMJ13_06680 [halophilic archaeon]